MKNKNKNGFTLIELLAVIVIIMMLIGLLMPALYGTKKQAKNKQSKAEFMAIETAIVNYKMDRREWPSIENKKDMTYGTDQPNAVVIKILTDEDPPYLDKGDFKRDSSGSVLDPWGDEYLIRLDTDYDGYFGGSTMPEGVKVISKTYPKW